mmetsp:Transcript_14756/g.42129  ORF Transcript_14756/g.42129 Transcript_14756/m.42129 type:complete len:260 (+) Transcript_14756:1050-1829(+)
MTTKSVARLPNLVHLLHLRQNLPLAHHQRVQPARHAQQVRSSVPIAEQEEMRTHLLQINPRRLAHPRLDLANGAMVRQTHHIYFQTVAGRKHRRLLDMRIGTQLLNSTGPFRLRHRQLLSELNRCVVNGQPDGNDARLFLHGISVDSLGITALNLLECVLRSRDVRRRQLHTHIRRCIWFAGHANSDSAILPLLLHRYNPLAASKASGAENLCGSHRVERFDGPVRRGPERARRRLRGEMRSCRRSDPLIATNELDGGD